MKLILPKNFVDVGPGSFYEKTPLFFLAGPVQGGGDWQRRALYLINRYQEHCLVAIPCRYSENDELRRLHASPYSSGGVFERQTDWEGHYLERASRNGCVLFWLACEDKENPRTDGEPYGRDTSGELGGYGWGPFKYEPNLHVVVGAEPDYHGLSVIKRNFDNSLKRDFPIYATLEETVRAAVQKSYE